MRAVIQRVRKAKVEVKGDNIGEIGQGILIFLGVKKGDSELDAEYLAEKAVNLRIFEDEKENMNLSLLDIKGEVLVVSQFTLFGDCRKGRRPSFTEAAPPVEAKTLYEKFIKILEKKGVKSKAGRFRAMMDIFLVNDGPVTILLDSEKLF